MCFALGALASVAAMFGVWSWYCESDARRLDRAARVYEVTDGALTSIARSHERVDDVGQSDSVNWLIENGRSISALNINDVSIRNIKIPLPILQPTGTLSSFSYLEFLPAYRENYPSDGACPSGNIVSIDWILIRNTDLSRLRHVCFYGTLLGSGILGNGIVLDVNPRHIEIHEVTSGFILHYTDSYTFSEDKTDARKQVLPTELMLTYSSLSRSKIFVSADVTRLLYSNLSHVDATFESGVVILSNDQLRNSKINVPSIASAENLDKDRSACTEKLKARRLAAAKPSPGADSSTEAKLAVALAFEDVLCDRVKGELPFRHADDVSSIYHYGIFVYLKDVDIRGADLSSVPGTYLIADNVCADDTTKPPAGVNFRGCSPVLSRYWDLVEDCDWFDPLTRHRGAKCNELAKASRMSDMEHGVIPSYSVGTKDFTTPSLEDILYDVPNPIGDYENIAVRFWDGRELRPHVRRWSVVPLSIIEHCNDLRGDCTPDGGASYLGSHVPDRTAWSLPIFAKLR
jgi:hypothetical protein